MQLAVIADEATALGWRLIGARVLLPGADSVQDCWRAALRGADLVMISAQYAAAVAPADLAAALLAEKPLVLVIEDLDGGPEPPEIEREVRLALGVSA